MKATEKFGPIPTAIRYDRATAAVNAAHEQLDAWRANPADPRDGRWLRAQLEQANRTWTVAVRALVRATAARDGHPACYQPALFEIGDQP